MFVVLHIKQLPGNHLEIEETSELTGTPRKSTIRFDIDGSSEYVSDLNYAWVHLNDANPRQWIINSDGPGSAPLVLDETVLPLTCVINEDSISYHYRDVGYAGTFISGQ